MNLEKNMCFLRNGTIFLQINGHRVWYTSASYKLYMIRNGVLIAADLFQVIKGTTLEIQSLTLINASDDVASILRLEENNAKFS